MHEFMSHFIKVCEDAERNKQKWIKELKEQGFKAAHPNDGWVDRENKRFVLNNPYFVSAFSLKVGDKVMLGWSCGKESQRTVIVTEVIINTVSLRGMPKCIIYAFSDLYDEQNKKE